ncbi:hypothetical protein [Mesorhizobium sp. M0809]|uniref:hypothetical protein n=1 Tax=Mesorhizobium sp. M0809 TaxID=2957003 RepID=UPI00333C6245
MMFGHEPNPEMIAWFDENRKKAGVTLSPTWLEGEPLERVLTRMEPHIERLKPINAAQIADADKRVAQKS